MIIILAMFAMGFGCGGAGRSSALMADSVDMLADGIGYARSRYAFALAMGGAVEVADKVAKGVLSSSVLMLGFGGGRFGREPCV